MIITSADAYKCLYLFISIVDVNFKAASSPSLTHSSPMALLEHTPRGLYCAAGDFYVDPWRPVSRAVITHAHADLARPGHAAYLAAALSLGVLKSRLGANANIDTVSYGELRNINGVTVSLHPAGHVLGSAGAD